MSRLLVVVLAGASQGVLSIPLCIDQTAPLVHDQVRFQTCSMYNGLKICGTEDSTLVAIYENVSDVSPWCQAVFQSISCAVLDQYSAWLFGAEPASTERRSIPKLCSQFCKNLYENCSSVVLLNSVLSPNNLSISSTYSSTQEFCDEFGVDSENAKETDELCFNGSPVVPVAVDPNYNPDTFLCVETVVPSSTPKTVISPVPDFPNLLVIADVNGPIRVYQVNDSSSGKAFNVSHTLIDLTPFVWVSFYYVVYGITFHKQFSTNGRFFVGYKCGENVDHCTTPGNVVFEEFRVFDPTTIGGLQANLSSRRQIYEAKMPDSQGHWGGGVLFSPDPNENNLFLIVGDDGTYLVESVLSQQMNVTMGKVLRVDVDSFLTGPGIPPLDNPFVDTPGADPLIWALGLRHPWKCSFDRLSYLFFCGDVGESTYEEIDVIVKGANYGWPRYEGLYLQRPDVALAMNATYATDPVFYYGRNFTGGGPSGAITGGYMVRSSTTNYGDYVMGAYLFADEAGPDMIARETQLGSGLFNVVKLPVYCADVSALACPAPNPSYIVTFGELYSGDILMFDVNGNGYRFLALEQCQLKSKIVNLAFPTLTPTTPTTEAPTSFKPSKNPTSSRPSKSPTTSRPSKSPTSHRPSATPTRKQTPGPTSKSPSISPTTTRPSQSPTPKPTTKSPTVITSRPTTKYPTVFLKPCRSVPVKRCHLRADCLVRRVRKRRACIPR